MKRLQVLRAPDPVLPRQRRFRPITRIQHRTTNAWGSALLWVIGFGMCYGAFMVFMLWLHKHV